MSDKNKLPLNFAMNFNTQDATTGKALQEQHDAIFNIAIMSNFKGRQGNIENANISERNFIEIDRYNFDQVIASMGITLSLALDNNSNNVDVDFKSLKDFHPDNLFKNVDAFVQPGDLRHRLNNPATFKQAMQEIKRQGDEVLSQQGSELTQNPQPLSDQENSQESAAGSLLDAILDGSEITASHRAEASAATSTSQQSKTLVDGFIQQLVANKSRPISRDAKQDEMVASLDKAISVQMRNLMHHPHFQALEAAWRALHFLVKRIPVNKKVKLYLLDVSREELATDLNVDDVTQSQLYQQFCDRSAGDIKCNLIIADYQFGADIDDILELSQLGIIAQQANAQLIAAAHESLVGCTSFAEKPKADHWQIETGQAISEAWTLLRESSIAKNINLALPRFMLRAPYGCKSMPVKTFAYEEISETPQHEEYLWGNPAFLKAEQLARSFIESGWDMQFTHVMSTQDLPLHYYEHDGKTIVKPCAEISLTDAGASKIISQGLIPLWSVKNSDRVHSGDFHSIAK